LELTWKEMGGLHAQLIHHASVNIEILANLADFTQQLYLGMPSYHSEWEAKWEKKQSRNFSLSNSNIQHDKTE
jgi:hypothetical protein